MIKDAYQKTIYTVNIEVAKPAEDVFAHVLDLSKWWPEEFVGEPIQPGSEFVFRIGDSHYSTNKVIEFLPNERVAWITTGNGQDTLLPFTHWGLTTDKESFARCSEGWNMIIKDYLFRYINRRSPTMFIKRLGTLKQSSMSAPEPARMNPTTGS